MKNIKANSFAMTAFMIAAIMAGCLGLYFVLCIYTHVAFTLMNAELWVGIGAIAVVFAVVAHVFKENRKQELAAAV